MPQQPLLEQRILEVLVSEGADAEHKKMFGGVAFMVRGNMSVGITSKGELMARFDPARHEEVLQWPGAKAMSFGPKSMKGFVFVEPGAVASKAALTKWVKLSMAFVAALPVKKKAAPKKKAVTKRAARK